MNIQPFSLVVDWPDIWCLMEVSAMCYICPYCVYFVGQMCYLIYAHDCSFCQPHIYCQEIIPATIRTNNLLKPWKVPDVLTLFCFYPLYVTAIMRSLSLMKEAMGPYLKTILEHLKVKLIMVSKVRPIRIESKG